MFILLDFPLLCELNILTCVKKGHFETTVTLPTTTQNLKINEFVRNILIEVLLLLEYQYG